MPVLVPALIPVLRSPLITPMDGANGGNGFTAEANALIARITAPPSAPRKTAINDTFVAAKAHDWLQHIDTMGWIGADAQASLLNWRQAAFNAVLVQPTTPVTFLADRYFDTNGTDNYIDLIFNAFTDGGRFVQNSAVFGAYFTETTQKTNSPAGWFDGADGTTINPRGATDLASVRINQGTAVTMASLDGSGLWVVERTAPTAYRIYRNGVDVGGGTGVSLTVNSASLLLGRSSAAGFQQARFAGWVQGEQMGPTKQAFMYNDIVSNYLTPIGAV